MSRLTKSDVEKIEADLRNGVSQRDIMMKYNIGNRKIKIIAEGAKIEIHPGRKSREVTQAEIDFVIQYRNLFHVGYHRTAQAARSRGIKASDNTIKKIFEDKNLYCFKIKKSENAHRFYAKYVGQLWHTDLHYLNKINNIQYYLIAFIDDCSKYVVYWEVIDEKTSIASALALAHALEKVPKPKMITIDNGGEFIGKEFQDVMNEKSIECFRTHPYTPEENGKVERFWLTLERARNEGRQLDECYINAIINEYNDVWEHSGLREQLGFSSTPSKAWGTLEKYNGQSDAEIIYSKYSNGQNFLNYLNFIV